LPDTPLADMPDNDINFSDPDAPHAQDERGSRIAGMASRQDKAMPRMEDLFTVFHDWHSNADTVACTGSSPE
jgi:hypothetical protein